MNWNIKQVLRGVIAGVAVSTLLIYHDKIMLGSILGVFFFFIIGILPNLFVPPLAKGNNVKLATFIKIWIYLFCAAMAVLFFVPYIISHSILIEKIPISNRPAALFIFVYMWFFVLLVLLSRSGETFNVDIKNNRYIRYVFFAGPIIGSIFFLFQYGLHLKIIFSILLLTFISYKFFKNIKNELPPKE